MSDGDKKRTYKVYDSLYYRALSYHKQLLKVRYQSHIIEEIKRFLIEIIPSNNLRYLYKQRDTEYFLAI